LCIYGGDLDPAEVTALLGGEPTHAHRKGDPSSRRIPYNKGAWIREVRQFEPIDPDAMVASIFSALTQESSVWSQLAARFRIQMDFAVHTEAGCNLVLSPETLKTLAARHTAFALDIYTYGASA
jgi:hypothetical protein